MYNTSPQKAFTLVELMIVIAIIGILAAALFPQMSQFINRSKSTATAKEVREIFSMFRLARDEAGKSLKEVSGSNCSDCVCRSGNGGSITSSGCLGQWKFAVDNITRYVGMRNNGGKWYTDEWGYPYLLDENEGEQPLCDQFLSYGYGVYKQVYLPLGLYDNGQYVLPQVQTPYDLPAFFPSIASASCVGNVTY